MNSHNHWLSNTLTKRMAPAISEILKGNSRRIWRESSISDWQANSELNVSCLGSAKHLCDVVFSSKKMTLILRYTESILCDRKSWVLGIFSRMILHVKSVSSSTIYGITLYPKHCREIIFLLWNDIELSWKLHLVKYLFQIFTYKYGIVVTF